MRSGEHKNTEGDYQKARKLRNESTIVERTLWHHLREAAKAEGIKFRRQQAIHPYIADFACLSLRLLVEVAGPSHDSLVEQDRVRESYLRQQGYHVIRFSNDDVMKNAEGVVQTIMSVVRCRATPPP